MSALGAIYGQAARLRRSWYERRPAARRTLTRPVVSVGNLAVGGTGKTPVTAAIARLLIDAGYRPSILSRGYARRRKSEGVVVVSDGQRVCAPVEDSGDEPQMLARMLPGVAVLVAPDRYLAGSLAERQLGCTVHILDDGFQHLQLARTVDLLLVRARDLDDHVLPAGRLREPRAAAASADAVLVADYQDRGQDVPAALGVSTAFVVEPRYGAVRWLNAAGAGPAADPDADAGARPRIVAVAGIANANRFFNALHELGWLVAHDVAFPDHHWFTAADHARIAAAVRASNAVGVVTTEKDAARLSTRGRGAVGAAEAGHDDVRWGVLPMEVDIRPPDEFREWLLQRLD